MHPDSSLSRQEPPLAPRRTEDPTARFLRAEVDVHEEKHRVVAHVEGRGSDLASALDVAHSHIREFFGELLVEGTDIAFVYGVACPEGYELSGKPILWRIEVQGTAFIDP